MLTQTETQGVASAALLDVGEVALLLNCSKRTVYRLADAGRMPRPLKLGALVRWNRVVVLEWIGAGCPTVRSVRAAKA